MCGRYYIDEEMAEEVARLLGRLEGTLYKPQGSKDICPGMNASVIAAGEKDMTWKEMKWGFPGFDKNRVIFNARSESVMEKRMFRESVEMRRCLVPVRGFYEWDKSKQKASFERKNKAPSMLAGVWKIYGEGLVFTILTTAANASVRPVHERMPLILEPEECLLWMGEKEEAAGLLEKEPPLLQMTSGYVQQSLFPL